MKPRYTRLPAACRRAREAEEAAAREFERWYWHDHDGQCAAWCDATHASFPSRPCIDTFSHLYDAKETPCS